MMHGKLFFDVPTCSSTKGRCSVALILTRSRGSTIANLKELRPECHGHIYRILYQFTEKREALLLVGDDKKGRDDRQFNHHLIRRAEAIIKDLSEEPR